MRKLAFAFVMSLAAMGSASAEDLIAKPAVTESPLQEPSFSWSGFYLGLQAGYAWGDVALSDVVAISYDVDEWIAGAHAGWNQQFGAVVVGLEADIEGAGVEHRFREINGTVSPDLNWQASLRARAGFVVGTALLYGTAGLAYADQETEFDLNTGSETLDHSAWGWSIGAGAEALVTDRISARVEYRYVDYATEADTSQVISPGVPTDADLDLHSVRAGASYHF